MFFKELFQALRRRTGTETMQRDMLAMLSDAQWMFQQLDRGLAGAFDDDERREFFERDKRINKAERAIRKSLVNHLTIDPDSDVITCLKLMSLVKDAERIGDYCKNALDLLRELPAASVPALWSAASAPALKAIYAKVAAMFEHTMRAFGESDEELARKVATVHKEVKRDCDVILNALMQGSAGEVEVSLAIGQSLLARFFRRIASHVENINSSVLLPLHRLDFDPEKGGVGEP